MKIFLKDNYYTLSKVGSLIDIDVKGKSIVNKKNVEKLSYIPLSCLIIFSGINVSKILSSACFYCLGMLIGADRGISFLQSHLPRIYNYASRPSPLAGLTRS